MLITYQTLTTWASATNVRVETICLVHFAHFWTAGGSPDRIGGKWQMRRIASVVVNGKTEELETLYQRDTNKGIILSTPLELFLEEGSNTITVGGLFNGVDCEFSG